MDSGEVTDEQQNQDAGEEANPEIIDLVQSRIEDMKEIPKTDAVKFIHLRWNLIKKIEDLNAVPNLVHLELYDNQITKIENLDSLTKLEVLDISVNRLTKIEGLENLENLQKLYLCSNKIQKIENVNHLKKLEEIELGDNKIRVIENLSGLDNLKKLYLGKNKIDKIKNLEDLKSLELLSLQSNRLTKIENLENLPQLKELHLSENGITEISGLENLPDLTTLDLASNKISLIENISHLQKLEEFWIDTNNISDWNTVENLGALKSLSTVYLEHNPISKTPTYRRKVRLILPLLEYLDAIRIRVGSGVSLRGNRSKSGVSLKDTKRGGSPSKASWKSNSRLNGEQSRSKSTDHGSPKSRNDVTKPWKQVTNKADSKHKPEKPKTPNGPKQNITVRATTKIIDSPKNNLNKSKSGPRYRIEVERTRREDSKMDQLKTMVKKELFRSQGSKANSMFIEEAQQKLVSENSRIECCVANCKPSGIDALKRVNKMRDDCDTGNLPVKSEQQISALDHTKLKRNDCPEASRADGNFNYHLKKSFSPYLNVSETRAARKDNLMKIETSTTEDRSKRGARSTDTRLRCMAGSADTTKRAVQDEEIKTIGRVCQTNPRFDGSKPSTSHCTKKS